MTRGRLGPTVLPSRPRALPAERAVPWSYLGSSARSLLLSRALIQQSRELMRRAEVAFDTTARLISSGPLAR